MSTTARPIDVVLHADGFDVRLDDGRGLFTPYSWFPRLEAASPAQRANLQHGHPLLRHRAIPVLTLTALLAACGGPPVAPLIPDDFTLQGVPVESDSTELRLTFGDPDSVTVSDNPFTSDAPLTTWHYAGFEIRFAGETTPSGYLLREPGERSARGVGVGDPAALALRLYGNPDAQYVPTWTWVDDSDPAMLRIIDVVVEADTVRRIYIGRVVN